MLIMQLFREGPCTSPSLWFYPIVYRMGLQRNNKDGIKLIQGRVLADFARISLCHEWIRYEYQALYSDLKLQPL